MKPTITQDEKKAAQAQLDKISQSAQCLNKMGLDVTEIMAELRFLNRALIIDSAQDINELPDISMGGAR